MRILAIYSNTLEDPGVIADKNIGDSQLKYLDAALKRVKTEGFTGALIIADHHPPYTASGARHGWSVDMLNHIDSACAKAGVWPHAFLSGHAHNYQRLTRTRTTDGSEIPYIVCGTGGYNDDAHVKESIRLPAQFDDGFSLAQFFDFQYGYMRMTIDKDWLTGEYVGVAKRHTNALPQTGVLESFNVDLNKHLVSSF